MPDEQRSLAFDPTVLLDAEAEVIARTACGQVAVFAGAPMPVIRAGFLRHLLLGLPAPCEPWPIRLFALAGGLFVIWRHRSNIARLRAGTEHRINLRRASNPV